MNINLKKKRSLFAIAFLCLVVLVGITIAYFTSTSNFENIFNAGTYKTVTTEVFTSPSNWAPGDETPKTISTKNEGTISVRVRVKFDESWTSKNDDDLPLEYNDENVAIINLDNELDWIKNGDYYYYTKELAPGQSTTSLIKSVTFNPNVPSDVSCSNTGGVYTCESTGDGYDGAEYKLNITTETVQANKYEEVWENVPIMYDYVGDNPCTYNGELEIGTEYVNGQYTYRYRQEMKETSWINAKDDGWGVILTDKDSTDPVTTTLCSSINNKPITSMSYMFKSSGSTSIDLSSFDTANVTNMADMFTLVNVSSLDFSNFDTKKVRNMARMFGGVQVTTLNLSDFDTSNVTNMSMMFASCKATTLDLSSFDTSNVTNMMLMFYYNKATTLDLSSFNTSNVTNMSGMFWGSDATSIDLSSFNTSSVTNMNSMFWGSKATTLDLGSFNTTNVTKMENMFKEAETTTGYARTQADADRLNATTDKPSTLTFVVKQS